MLHNLSRLSRTDKSFLSRGLLLWGLMMVLILSLAVWMTWQQGGARLSTDLLQLMPTTEQDPASEIAADRFTRNFSQRVTIMVSSASRDAARRAAEDLERRLSGTQIFEELVFRIKPELWDNIARYYYPHRFQLLSASQRSMSDHELGKQLVENSLSTLVGPMGMVNSGQLVSDPLLLMPGWFRSLQGSNSDLKLDEGILAKQSSGQYQLMMTGLLKEGVLTLSRQASVVNALNEAMSRNRSSHQGVTIVASGLIFHAQAGADSARAEVSTIGVGSLMGIVLLIISVFRSIRPLLLCLMSIVTGILAGYLATVVVFETVHVMTLVFGASLIGISIDYTFHYLVEWQRQGKHWKPLTGLKHILPGITLGLLTSLLGYVPMLMTPFPGLQQIAVFSCVGLTVAWMTVVLAYPRWLSSPFSAQGRFPASRGRKTGRWLEGWADLFWFVWYRLFTGRRLIVTAGVALLLLGGLMRLTVNDDIRQLQKRSPALEQADQQVKDMLGDVGDGRFFLVYGDSEQLLLEREEVLDKLLHLWVSSGELSGYQSVSRLMPSIRSQQESYGKLASIYQNQLPDLWQRLGVNDAAQAAAHSAFVEGNHQWIRPEEWLGSDAAGLYGYLWLGAIGVRYYSAVVIQGAGADWQPASSISQLSGVLFVDKTGETSALFGRYRVLMGWLLVVSYGLISVLLSVRYGFRGAIKVVMPPLLSVLLTLAVLGWTGEAINLFHALALLMILGIGVDYTLFFREAGSGHRYTLMAITLSAMTTLLSFGLLALSETAAIRGFGLTVLTGISFCYLLSPFAGGNIPGQPMASLWQKGRHDDV